jgi:hypothetical protein
LYENRCNHFKMFHESYLEGSIPGFFSRDKLREWLTSDSIWLELKRG